MINQVSRDEELLNIARDYFHFVTKFFEPINVSATHIYHSALGLSPLSSIIRRLYYHQRDGSSPRVVVGIQDSWEPSLAVPHKHSKVLCTWSPCGRFIAAGNGEGVEIRDPLSFELLSTLIPTEPTQRRMDQLAYSMDGRSVASVSGTLLIIWDTQTGGVVKEIEHEGTYGASLAWSLNRSTIGIISKDLETGLYTVYIYDVVSGVMRSPGTLPSRCKPYLWAHDASFRVMTTARDEGCIINIFEVGSALIRIESFRIGLWIFSVESFSQSTYRISVSFYGGYSVFDLRTSDCLLTESYLSLHCFSSDGSLFAGISGPSSCVRIWKYASNRYMSWREFPLQGSIYTCRSLRFSPASSSLLAGSGKLLQLWRLDGPSVVHPDRNKLVVALSRCGSYIATGDRSNTTVTITNLVSQTPPHSIQTGITIESLALTGNVLLVDCYWEIAAWRLTEAGAVDRVLSGRTADRGDSIWTASSDRVSFSVQDQTVTIRQEEQVIHAYHTATGEVLKPSRAPPHNRRDYSFQDMVYGRHNPHYHNLDPASSTTGWVRDLEGKHRLWIPVEWRNPRNAIFFGNSKTLRLDYDKGETVLIRF